jgi:hypothetical protein
LGELAKRTADKVYIIFGDLRKEAEIRVEEFKEKGRQWNSKKVEDRIGTKRKHKWFVLCIEILAFFER